MINKFSEYFSLVIGAVNCYFCNSFSRGITMYRTHNCGELRISNVREEVTLSGWVQKVRDKGGMIWVDLRDRYGITQLALEEGVSSFESMETAKKFIL